MVFLIHRPYFRVILLDLSTGLQKQKESLALPLLQNCFVSIVAKGAHEPAKGRQISAGSFIPGSYITYLPIIHTQVLDYFSLGLIVYVKRLSVYTC